MTKTFAAVALGLLICGASTCPAIAASAEPPAAMHVIAKIAGPDGGWDYASFDAVHRRMYFSRDNGVTAIDIDTRAVHPRFAQGADVHSVVVIPGGRELLTTNSGDNTARFLSATDGALIATVHTGKKPDAATYDPASGLVFVMNGDSGDSTAIDPRTHKVVKTIPIGGGLEFAVPDGKGRLFVNVEDRNHIAVIDTRALRATGQYALKGCQGPTGLALTRAGLLISACHNGVAKIVDSANGADLGSLKIGAHPDAVIYDPARAFAYIPCGDSGTLIEIGGANGRRPSVVATIPTQTGAKTGALDAATGRVWLPTATKTPSKTPGGKASVSPGTFHVLVVGR